MFGIKANSTILEYFSYFRDAYLLEFLPQFSYSLKTQTRNPKKVYTMDMGLYTQNSTIFSENLGHRLENLIYIYLRTKFKNLYYFKGKGECDFVAIERGNVKQLLQVCFSIDDMNFKREYGGLLEAMKYFKVKTGLIITFNQEDLFEENEFTIKLIPAHKYLSE